MLRILFWQTLLYDVNEGLMKLPVIMLHMISAGKTAPTTTPITRTI